MAELEACRVTDQAVVVGLYPDVCLTPPNNAPVPYAVIARFSDGVRARATVRFRGLDAMTDFGRISRVYGDEAGLGGGVRSGVNMGMCRPKVASSSVRINGQYVVRHTDEIEMNCAGPEGPSNTTGKVMYVPVGTPLAVGPMGEVAGDTDPPVEPETPEEIGFLGQVGGFFKGMKDGAVDAAVGVKDLAVGGFWVSDVGQFVNPERSDQARETLRTTAGAIWDDPGLVWDGIKEPYVEAWGRGAYGEAIGRGTLEAVLAVVGTKGADKAAKGATAASRAAGAVDDVARLADDVARLGDDAARAAASATDDAARAGTDGLRVVGYPPGYPAYLTSNPYSGVQRASAYLRSQGVPRRFRKQILESFDIETIRVRSAGPNEFGIRYFDDVNASADGRYLFETFPASREALALKMDWNWATKVKQWQITPGTTLLEGNAAAQGLGYPGGIVQKYILDPSTDLVRP